jgi:hypothetical protein
MAAKLRLRPFAKKVRLTDPKRIAIEEAAVPFAPFEVPPFLDEEDLLDRPTPSMLVDDLIVAGTLTLLVSQPGMGKSFVALDLVLSIAARRSSFAGLPLRRQGPVLYIIGEGAGRFKLRVKAWRQHHGIDPSERLPFYWNDGPLNLRDDRSVQAFIAGVQRLRPLLIVFDTLSRCLVGADENSQAAMTEVIENLDRIRTAVTGLTILILHHTNAGGTRERGSTVLKGAVDTQLELSHPKKGKGEKGDDEDDEKAENTDRILLTVTKEKDLDDSKVVKLAKVKVAIADEVEASGKPATSLVWVPAGKAPLDVLTHIRKNPGRSKNMVLDSVGGNRRKGSEEIHSLVTAGQVRIEKKGQAHRLYPCEPS